MSPEAFQTLTNRDCLVPFNVVHLYVFWPVLLWYSPSAGLLWKLPAEQSSPLHSSGTTLWEFVAQEEKLNAVAQQQLLNELIWA